MPENEKNENRTKMSVTKFHSYYNFQHKWVKVGNEEQFKFLSTVYSDLTHLIRVDYKIEDSRENFINNVDPKKNVIEGNSGEKHVDNLESVNRSLRSKMIEIEDIFQDDHGNFFLNNLFF
jgi:hypothetical protein